MSIPINSTKTVRQVFDEFVLPDGNYSFNKTIVPVRFASIGGENLISRSQAKRLVARFERFKTVVPDFDQIDTIGQAFSDEVFRVFADNHPDVTLIPVNTCNAVMQMIEWVERKKT
ncbi:MAG: STAS-like domain-containing protein [Oxalobacter sp.]